MQDAAGFDEAAFRQVHASGEQITSVRFNPAKWSKGEDVHNGNVLQDASPFVIQSGIPWSEYGYYLASRPSFTFDPLFHAGTYYVQEASSMFLEQAVKQLADLSKPLKVLDLCAAPGGKSTHLQSLISSGSLLVSNEVIRSRASVLKDNIIKWGCENVLVTNNDPKDFAKLENYFDVVVTDAPCSGSGLFRRDEEAITEWSENNVALCSQRQQRILADMWPSLKENGILVYSTCSYSTEEDENIMDWLTNELSAENCELKFDKEWGITETISKAGNHGYRFWPDKVKGEGFFLACFRKKDGQAASDIRLKLKPDRATKKEETILSGWVKNEGRIFVKHQQLVYAWPEDKFNDFAWLLQQLKVLYAGVLAGELMGDKLVPDHALALSLRVSPQVGHLELNKDQSIQYLQRKDLRVDAAEKGWKTVTFRGHSLGWVNVLANRINNYYPKELRILKDL